LGGNLIREKRKKGNVKEKEERRKKSGTLTLKG
jgi:hypothetical protein